MKRRLFSLLLTGAMLLSMCPPGLALEADTGGLCPHHQEHSYELCGYVEAVEGQPCGHVHDGDCGFVEAVPEVPCDMDCAETGEDGQIIHVEGCAYAPEVEGAPCQHEHDSECGYVEAIEGQPCGYVCPVCPVQAGNDLPMLAAAGDVEYLYCDANGQNWQTGTKASGDYTAVTANDTAWGTAGTTTWYVVSGDVTIGTADTAQRVTVSGDVHLILVDSCTLTVNGGIKVQDDDKDIKNGSPNSLTIYGQVSNTGKLTAQGGQYEAGIGGNLNGTGGTVIINGGNVTAIGGTGGAGIGGAGGYNSGGHIIINGGIVSAKASADAAGIGGAGGPGGYIVINGGNVTATGEGNGAGIGGSGTQGSGGEITINGGKVIANGGGSAAGIGGGSTIYGAGDGGIITINNGDVTATGPAGGAGIGGGNGANGGTININGGTVTAQARKHQFEGISGAGIGGGGKGEGGTINISGGTVIATSAYDGAGIGGGGNGGSGGIIIISGGTVTASGYYGAAGVGAGKNGSEGTFSTGMNGNAFINASSISDHDSTADWSGVIFQGKDGEVYNDSVTLTSNAEIPRGKTLTIPADTTLTIDTGVTLTNSGTIIVEDGGTFINNGTLKGDKITPTVTVPTGLTATYGQTLANVALPTGWAWNVPTTSVGNVGSNTFSATFTPTDTTNYKSVTQNLTVAVSVAPRTIAVTGQAVSPTQITLNDAKITPSGTGGTVSYGKNTTNTAPGTWQSEKEFTGLTAGTTYYFFAKVEASENYTAAVSEGVAISTPAKAVSGIAITGQPTTLNYTSGQTLDLSGLSVTVSYNDSTSETIAWSEGSLTADPAEGTTLTVTGHNGKTVTISYSGQTAETNTLTVTQGTQATLSITGAPATIYSGDSFTLTLSGGSGTGAVAWKIVSGPATVDASGKVTVTSTGEIQIKAVKAADADYTQAEATITLNAVTRPTPPPTKYLVTVNGGTGGGSYAAGDTVTVTATVPSGQRFTGWTVNAGGVTLDNANSVTTTFTMPAQAVTMTANFQSNSDGGSSGGGGSSSYTPPTYKPDVSKPSGGGGEAPAVSPSNPKQGDTVTVTPKPDDGYEVDKITVTDKGGNDVPVTKKPDGTYTFKQPSGRVTIEIEYTPVPTTDLPWNSPFSDVAVDDWYYEAVRFVHERGLMNGYSDGRFGPNDTLSRAQLAQILFNKEGRPAVNYLLAFSDVAGEAWYTEAIRWATSQGIVGGYGNGTFGPNDPITREQLAVMLWRYSGSPAATNKELYFNDADEISPFALEAMRWAVESGILNGYGDGRLGPQGQATRAQVAQMLKNFIENLEENT